MLSVKGLLIPTNVFILRKACIFGTILSQSHKIMSLYLISFSHFWNKQHILLRLVLLQLIGLLSFSATLAQQSFNINTPNPKALQKFFTWTENRIPLVSAHRGGIVDSLPENSIAAFAHTNQNTYALIECDVRLSKDSVLVLMHDKTLERTTSGQGNVSDYTWAELQKLYLKDNRGNTTEYRIPTLAQTLTWAKGRVLLTLDIKRGVPANLVVEQIRKYRAESYALVITYNMKDARTYHQLAPEVMQSVTFRSMKDYENFERSGIPYEQIIAFVGVDQFDSKVIQALHKKGVFCILGTMRETDKQAKSRGPNVYKTLINQGIDILATDNPIIARQSIESYLKNKSPQRNYMKTKR